MRRIPFLPPLVLLAILPGCREDVTSPTVAEPEPSLATAAATAPAFTQMSAGHDFSCGIAADGRGYCWGRNTWGEVGDGGTENRLVPTEVSGGLRFRQISAGFANACGVTTDYRAHCWGINDTGAHGTGNTTPHRTPVAVLGGLRFRQVETNFGHTCGVTYPDNRAYCWGRNADGQLGDGTRTDRTRPVAVLGSLTFSQITAGYYHVCGVATDGQAYCWGANRSGQIGDSTEVGRRTRPRRVAAGTRRFIQLEAGSDYTCGVTTENRALCWGNGRQGQLGNGKTNVSLWPRGVSGGLSFIRVTAAYTHSCGRTTANRLYCWGLNYNGQLGDGGTTNTLTPVAVAGGLAFSQVTAGISHTCGRTPDLVGYCWGRNFTGQLGIGTTPVSWTPARVGGS